MMDSLAQLHDIEGLDAISWWPFAPGWWAILIVSISILLVVFIACYRKHMFKQSWQYSVLRQLSVIENTLLKTNAQGTAIELSELIRRIAMHHSSRIDCAGLEGKAWLTWLTQHDPHQFDWETKGQWLIEAPYAPFKTPLPLENIHDFIKAIRGWVK